MSNDVIIQWEKFNNLADIPKMLQHHGWKEVKKRGVRIDFRRPGKAARDGVSGNWHTRKRLFYVFTTSTSFAADRAYNAAQVFSVLECGGSMREAARKLIELGYCEPRKLEITGEVEFV